MAQEWGVARQDRALRRPLVARRLPAAESALGHRDSQDHAFGIHSVSPEPRGSEFVLPEFAQGKSSLGARQAVATYNLLDLFPLTCVHLQAGH